MYSEYLLIVHEDAAELSRLTDFARARGYHVTGAPSSDALEAADGRPFSGAIVDASLGGSQVGVELVKRLKKRDPDVEIVVMSQWPLPSTQAHGLAASGPPAADFSALFATLERALECRRTALENRRLMWELHLLDEIAESVAGSLDLDVVLQRALQQLSQAFHTDAATIRLRNEATSQFEVRAHVGLSAEQLAAVRSYGAGVRPSDRVIATGEPVIVHDLQAEPWMQAIGPDRPPLRGMVAAPIVFANQLIGTLGVGSVIPGAFGDVDQRLLMTIAHHLGIAVANARLHSVISRAKIEWERTCDAIGEAIGLFDTSGRLVRTNAALAAKAGWPITATRGRSCDEVGYCGEPFPGCAVGRAIRDREASREEITKPDGEIFSVVTLPIDIAGGRLAAVQVAKNVTDEIRTARQRQALSIELAAANARLTATLDELRAAQAQLVQSEKLAAIGQLVAGVAHELNNPLTSIIGFSQLVRDELEEVATEPRFLQPREDMQRIAEESERAARIVKNLLAFARQQTGERGLHAVPDLVTGVLDLRAYDLRLNGVELDVRFEPDLPPVWCDANQVQQALLNIVLNGEQAVLERGSGGRLEIHARYDTGAQAVVLAVVDNGPGIAPELLLRVFDPFFTTKAVGKGTGLGLSICYGIVRDHGGTVRAESEPGVRTTFWIELPARRATATWDPLRLLVAHGDQHARDFVAAVLTGWGHRVTTAAAARDAFDALEAGGLDALLVDRGTLREDPAAWRAELSGRSAPLPVIVLSPGADTDEAGQLARARALAFVDPPFQLAALQSALRACSKELV